MRGRTSLYKTSDTYKNIVHASGTDWNAKALIVLADGTNLEITDADIMQGGLTVEKSVSEPGEFTVGGAIIGELTMDLNNFEGKFTKYDFTGASVYPFVGPTLKVHWHDGKIIEWVPLGVYTVDEPHTVGSVVKIAALDNMEKLDRPYDSKLTYPATLANIALDVCNRHGLTLDTITFTNSDYIATTKPSQSSITDREILAYTAQLAGCYVKANRKGHIQFNWYDFNSSTVQTEFRKSNRYNIATADIEVTGIQIIPQTSDGKQYTYGTSNGYIVKIENNPLAQDSIQQLTDSIGKKIVSMKFRPYSIETFEDPSIDVGDVTLVTDKKGNIHKSFVSTTSYKIDAYQVFTADAETVSKNKSLKFSLAAKAQERAEKAQEAANEAYSKTGEIEQEFKAADGQLLSRITDTENNLQSQITQNEREISSKVSDDEFESEIDQLSDKISHKVSKGQVSSIIEQSSQEVKMAFNTIAGQYQAVKTDGEKLSFYKGSTHIGDIGVNNNSLVFNLVDGYAMAWQCRGGGNLSWYPTSKDGVKAGFHIGGNVYVDGDVHSNGDINADNIHDGYSGNVGIVRSDGSNRTLHFEDGILTDNDY